MVGVSSMAHGMPAADDGCIRCGAAVGGQLQADSVEKPDGNLRLLT